MALVIMFTAAVLVSALTTPAIAGYLPEAAECEGSNFPR
jgi:hypothetical protein